MKCSWGSHKGEAEVGQEVGGQGENRSRIKQSPQGGFHLIPQGARPRELGFLNPTPQSLPEGPPGA